MVNANYQVRPIEYDALKPFILNIHYAKRMPSAVQYKYGLYRKDNLVGVITYGQPASPALCKGIAGEQNRKYVIELSRLVLKDNKTNEASFLVGNSLKLLDKPKIVVSYADTAQKHNGTVYQATNFLFTGTTKARTDIAGKDGKHSRHHLGDKTKRVYRSAKHRYVYLHGTKLQKRRLLNDLNYQVLTYKDV